MSELTRKKFIQGTAGLAIASHGCASKFGNGNSEKRPNVLFVMTDEWRAHAFSAMGDENARTPTFDKFRNESIDFSEAIAGTPVCCPARASWITGQYALTHGVYINDVPLKPTVQTFGEAFKKAGYRTGYIGKWHLYGSPEGRYERRLDYIPLEERFGFDYWKVCECTHDYNNSLYYENNDARPKYWDGYDAIAQTDDAIRFISEHGKSLDPYCLVLSWGPPHFPYAAPKQYVDMYKDRDIALRPNVPDFARQDATTELRGYYAAIAALDDCFSRLLMAVEASGADDTIVVFTSDHGEMALSQGLIYKLYPWEESIRVPFMVRYPRAYGRVGGTSVALLNSADIMPTVLGFAGIDPPPGLEGFDFSELRAGNHNEKYPGTAFLSLPVPITTARTYGFDAYRGVRDQRYTYVRSPKGPWLLYDNERDPYQMRNIVNAPEAADVQLRLERELSDWLKRLDDDFLAPESYLRESELEHFAETVWPIGVIESPWGDWRSTADMPASQARSIDDSFTELFREAATAEILESVNPELRNLLRISMLAATSPRVVNRIWPERLSAEQLQEIDRRLGILN